MNIGKEINKDIANHAEPQSVSPVNDLDDFSKQASFDISDIYGHWVIGDVAFRDITSLNYRMYANLPQVPISKL